MEATMWGGTITRLQLQQMISRFRKLDELPEGTGYGPRSVIPWRLLRARRTEEIEIQMHRVLRG